MFYLSAENSDGNNSRPVSGRRTSPDRNNASSEALPTEHAQEQSSGTQSSVTPQEPVAGSSGGSGIKAGLERSGSLPAVVLPATTGGSLTGNSRSRKWRVDENYMGRPCSNCSIN